MVIQTTKPKPYDISVPKEKWAAVQQFAQLADIRPFLSKLDDSADESRPDHDFANDFGIKSSRLEALLDRLKNGYDYYVFEDQIKAMGDHLVTTVTGIDREPGLDVHFILKKSSKQDAPWLLLVHGWPGRFHKIHKLLGDRYNLVIPSIPGYAYSSAPRAGHDFTLEKVAIAMDAVMQSIGVSKYAAQGGDWGFYIVTTLAHMFPDRVRGIHVNYSGGSLSLPVGDRDNEPCKERFATFVARGTAYQAMHIQCPYTIGAMLALSPLSTIAYIAEKFYRWSDQNTQPSQDEILTGCLLYWFTASTTSSMWLYYTFQGQKRGIHCEGTNVPAAFGGGKHDIMYTDEEGFRLVFKNVVHFHLMQQGGHFAALEVPQALANDVIEFMESETVKASFAS